MSTKRRSPVSKTVRQGKRKGNTVRKMGRRIKWTQSPDVRLIRAVAQYLGIKRWTAAEIESVRKYNSGATYVTVCLVPAGEPSLLSRTGRDDGIGGAVKAHDATTNDRVTPPGRVGPERNPSQAIHRDKIPAQRG